MIKLYFNRIILNILVVSLIAKLNSSAYQLSLLLISIGILWAIATLQAIYRESLYYFSPLLLLVFFYFLAWLLSGGPLLSFLKLSYGALIIFLACVYFYSVGRCGHRCFSFAGVFVSSFLILLFIVLFVETKGVDRELNSNFIGMLAVVVYLSFLMTRLKAFLIHYLVLFFLVYICLINDAKAALLALFSSYLIILWWEYLVEIPRIVFFLLLAFVFGLSAVYVYLTAEEVIHLVLFPVGIQDVMAKFLYSGREELWRILISNIYDSYWFGLGLGAQKVLLSGLANSAHNLFLQVLIQSGIGALFSVVWFFFYTIWRLFKRGKDGRVSAAIVSAIFILSVFEVFLTENNFLLGLIFMSFLSLSLGMSDSKVT